MKNSRTRQLGSWRDRHRVSSENEVGGPRSQTVLGPGTWVEEANRAKLSTGMAAGARQGRGCREKRLRPTLDHREF